MTKIILTPLKQAISSLDEIMKVELDGSTNSKFIRDGAIQRFEYTYELAWKMLKRTLKELFNIQEPLSVKDVYREAGKLELIDNVESWFEYHRARNQTSHTYEEKIAMDTYKAAKEFLADAKILLTKLESVNKNASN